MSDLFYQCLHDLSSNNVTGAFELSIFATNCLKNEVIREYEKLDRYLLQYLIKKLVQSQPMASIETSLCWRLILTC